MCILGFDFPSTCRRPEASPVRGLLQYVPPGDNRWTTDRAEFDELIALTKDSAPGPDRIPYGAYKRAGELGSQFLLVSA